MTRTLIQELLQSYVNFRTAVLRITAIDSLTKAEFTRLTGLGGGSKRARLLNPNLWHPAEIDDLAHRTGLSEKSSYKLAQLAELLVGLPDPERTVLLRVSGLSRADLLARQQDTCLWRATEVTKLATYLGRTGSRHSWPANPPELRL